MLHRELPPALWSLEFYHSIILNLCQQLLPSYSLDQGNSTSKRFWRAIDHLKFLDSPASNQEIFVLLNHPDQTIELRPSQAASQLISFTCLAMEPTKGVTHLSENLFIKEDSCAKQYLFLQFQVEYQIVESVITLCFHHIWNLNIEEYGHFFPLSSQLCQNRGNLCAYILLNHEN